MLSRDKSEGHAWPQDAAASLPQGRLRTPEEHGGSQACSPLLGGQDTSLRPSFIITDSGLRKKDTAAFQTVSYTEKTKTGI